MPVIGRLDSQVNDVLIEPVGEQRRRGGCDPHDAADRARPAAAGDAARSVAEGADGEARDGSRPDKGRDEQLPVWLL
ncbi:MAG: hypothetical protein ABR554_10980 [Pyrinomonadaceae bacterium]